MLVEKRQESIVEQVNQEGSVLVKELAKKFDVTEDAVRIRAKIASTDIVARHRVGKNQADKVEIAKRALTCIEEGDLIYLDLSTSNLELARLLLQTKKNVTVVTNMIEILLLYTQSDQRNLVFVGGNLNRQGDAFSGAMTNQQLEQFHFDKVFMGLEGLDLESGEVYNFSIEDATTKQFVLHRCKKAYMMMETRKFVMAGNVSYAQLDDFTGIIMEKEPDERIRRSLEQRGLELL